VQVYIRPERAHLLIIILILITQPQQQPQQQQQSWMGRYHCDSITVDCPLH